MNRLKYIRNQFGLSQDEFADRIGFSTIRISQLELKENPHFSTRFLDQMETIFGVNRDWLVNGKHPVFISNQMDEIFKHFEANYELTQSDKRIIQTYLELPKKERDIFVTFIESFAQSLIEKK